MFEHPVVQASLNDIFFADGEESLAVMYPNVYNPIPLATLAFIFTLVRHLSCALHHVFTITL